MVPALVAAALALLVPTAFGQTDPYTGATTVPPSTPGPTTTAPGGPTTTAQVGGEFEGRITISLNITEAVPGQVVRVQGCYWQPGQLLRLTFNPGQAMNPGDPCPGAERFQGAALGEAPVEIHTAAAGTGGALRQFVEFVPLQTRERPCAYDRPTPARTIFNQPDGGFSESNADEAGCADVLVTVPNADPGTYELCGHSTGLETVCARVRIVAATGAGADDNGTRVAGRGFARTGFSLLPWIIGALLAILAGRHLVNRSRRPARHGA